MSSFLQDQSYKCQFSGHETFPLRQLWLPKAYSQVHMSIDEDSGIAPRSVFSGEDAITRFGVGKNMVSSIKHWALASGIISADGVGFKTTSLGDLLYELDPYIENSSTSWLIHWMLTGLSSTRAFRSTTWAWVFNYLTKPSFDSHDVLDGILQFLDKKEKKVSKVSIQRDIEVCLKSYAPRSNLRLNTIEDIAEPILAELGLLAMDSNQSYRFRRGMKSSLHVGLFGYALLEFWDNKTQTNATTSSLSFDAIAYDHGSPGRVFKLDETSISEYINRLERLSGNELVWSDTAGIRQIVRREECPNKATILRAAYG